MDKAGLPITFDAVAREAGVSRSWLYNQPDLRTEVERLRAPATPSDTARPGPATGNAPPTPPCCQRLQAATERIKHLEAENRQLREALAHALGQQRTNAVRGDRRDTPTTKFAAIIGPC